MASEVGKVPPAEDTVVGEEAVTQVGEGWPVADLYLVEQDGGSSDDVEEPATSETVVLAQTEPVTSPARRLLPESAGTGLMLAIAGTVGLLIAVAAFLGLRDDDSPRTTPAALAQTTPSSPPGDAGGGSATRGAAGADVTLRDLEGMPVAKARLVLEQEGLRVLVRRVDADRPRGQVLTQDPPSGTAVDKGDRITLVVSNGGGAASPTPSTPTSSQVPAVVGLDESDATAAIRDAGFEARVRLVTSSRPAGTVLRQSPAPGSEAAEDRVVVLDVANRPVVQRVDVPDVVGTNASAARRALRSAGLTVSVVTVQSEEPKGTVVEQSPGAGAEVRKGASVKLTVSSGPSMLTVPDVTGIDEQSARLELANAGFEVQVTDERTTDTGQDGLVLAQAPAAGTEAREGSVITLTVGRFG